MSPNAKQFIEANKTSPVISGAVLEPDPNKTPRGCSYTLKSGRYFILSAEDCRDVGMPRWDL